MKVRHLPLTWLAAILFAAGVQAEPKDPQSKAQMYEDIEIMRRLLEDKVLAPYHAAPTLPYGGMPGMGGVDTVYESRTYYNPNWPHSGAMPTRCEGVYLKGQGVVFTMTLPPTDGNVTGVAPAPDKKPTTDWDRMRKQVRGEKPAEDGKNPAPPQRSLSEIILHVLADNGSHFGDLGDSESITVVVTFRQAQRGLGDLGAYFQYQGKPTLNDSPVGPVYAQPKAAPPKGDKPKTQAEEYLLLGDLHRKQGNADEALKTYRKAVDLTANDPNLKSLLLIKIAEILKEQGREQETQDTVKLILELIRAAEQKGSGSPAEATNVLLPGKLIVSASKKLLDQVGSGKMGFDEFAKGASVELLNFGPGKKQE